MSQSPVEYRSALEASLRIGWRIEDVLPEGARLDPTRPFLPESLSQVERVGILDARDRLTLDHIRCRSYLGLFGLVEEFILPFVADHARARLDDDRGTVRALLQFACEEAKHIELFERFMARFDADVGVACERIGPAADIRAAVLAHDPLGVALAILHIEWMTQRHWVEAVHDDRTLDPLVKSLLRHHWLEEAQHARLDTLIVEALAAQATPADVARGVADYERIVRLLNDGLDAQVELDLAALERARGDALDRAARDTLRAAQRRAYHDTFIRSGAEHPRFRATLAQLARA